MNMKQVMRDYFLDLDQAASDPERKVAWCTSVGPAEILRAMGFEVFFPENHGAMLGATRICMDTIPKANAFGYSPDICSYLTSDVGAYLKGITPLTRAYGIESIPRPDVLVYNTNQCKDVMHWFEFFAREFDAPVFGIHPPTHLPQVEPSHVADVVAQFEDLIELLEQIQGKPLDQEALRKACALSKEATDLWAEVLETAMAQAQSADFFRWHDLHGADRRFAWYRNCARLLPRTARRAERKSGSPRGSCTRRGHTNLLGRHADMGPFAQHV